MRISYNPACTLHNSSFEEDVELCEKAGFEYIELRIEKIKKYLVNHTIGDLATLFSSKRIRPHAINVIYTYSDFLSKNDHAESSKKVLDDIMLCCEVSQGLKVKDLVVVPPMYTELENRNYDFPWAKNLEDNTRIFSGIADIVEPYDMRIGIEIVGAPRCSIRTVEQCNMVISSVNKKNVGYTLDAFNLYLYSKDDSFVDVKNTDADRVFIVHVNGGDDKELISLRQSHRNYVNKGVMNVINYISNLKAIGYTGPVSIEFFRQDQWERPSNEVINEAYTTTAEMLRSCGVIEEK